MKNIVQIWKGEKTWLSYASNKAVKEYAQRIGADYFLDPYIKAVSGQLEKFKYFREEYDEWGEIVFVDCDVIPRKDLEESIFDEPGWACPSYKGHRPNFVCANAMKTDAELRQQIRSLMDIEEAMFNPVYEDLGIADEYYFRDKVVAHIDRPKLDVDKWNSVMFRKYQPIEKANFFHLQKYSKAGGDRGERYQYLSERGLI